MGKKERDWLGGLTPEHKAEYMYQYLVVGDVMSRVDEYMGVEDFKACSTLHRYYGFGGINHGLYKGGHQGRTVTKEDFIAYLSLYPTGLPQEQVIVNQTKNQGDVFRAFLEERHEVLKQEEAKRRDEENRRKEEERRLAQKAKEEEQLRMQQEAASKASQNSATQQNAPSMESFSSGSTTSNEKKTGMGMLPMVVGGLAVAYALFSILT